MEEDISFFGSWSPGIGDPTPMGWFTVVAYFVAAICCLRAHGRSRSVAPAVPRERRVRTWWLLLFAFLAALGVNKQLDLQTALTEVGRYYAHHQGWYEDRRAVQVKFIWGVGATALLASIGLAWLARGAFGRLLPALLGAVFLLAFVLVRASSFHRMDLLIHREVLGLRVNWILELSGIGLIGFAAFRDRPTSQQPLAPHHGGALITPPPPKQPDSRLL